MTFERHLKNESGIAALMMVIAALIIVSLVGINFVIEQENKHQGSAVTVNAEQAQANAEAGWRYAQKCLTGNDPSCPCNTGPPNNCTNWTGMVNFPVIGFGGTGGSFQVAFSNQSNCSIDIASTGIVNNTRRTINDLLTRTTLGAGSTVTVANAQSLVGPTIPAISVNNIQSEFSASNGSNTLTEPNYTVPAGTNLVLVVMAGAEGTGGNRLPTGITFNGIPMVLAEEVEWGGNPERPGVAQYYLNVVAGQVGDIIVTWAGNTSNRTIVALTLANALAAPEVTVTSFANANSFTENITTLTTGAMIITSSYADEDNDVTTLGAGHTELTGNDSPTTSEAESAMGFLLSGAPGLIVGTGYDWSGVGNTRWANVFAAYSNANRIISMNYTVPAGNGQVLVVVAGAEDAVNPSPIGSTLPVSATFAGIPMNLVTNNNINFSGAEVGVGMFWLGVNAGDAGTITVTYADSTIEDKTLHAYTLNDATGPPERVETTTATNGGSLTDNFTNVLTAGAMIATGAYQGNSNVFTALPNPGTHIINSQVSAASSQGVMGSRPVPVAETPTGIGFETSPDFNRMAMILASFPPTGGGPCL